MFGSQLDHPSMTSNESPCHAVNNSVRCTRTANRYSLFCDGCAPLVYGYAIRQSSIIGAGLGLFAVNNTESGSIVDLYCGECLPSSNPVPDSAYACDVSGKYIVDAVGTQSCITRYINHSTENANCAGILMTPSEEAGIKYTHMLIHTTKSIKRDEELFIDYGSEYSKSLQFFCKSFGIMSETAYPSGSRQLPYTLQPLPT